MRAIRASGPRRRHPRKIGLRSRERKRKRGERGGWARKQRRNGDGRENFARLGRGGEELSRKNAARARAAAASPANPLRRPTPYAVAPVAKLLARLATTWRGRNSEFSPALFSQRTPYARGRPPGCPTNGRNTPLHACRVNNAIALFSANGDANVPK